VQSLGHCRITEILGQSPLFEKLSLVERTALSDAATIRFFPAKTTIFKECQPCQGLWILGTGQVKVSHSGRDGRDHVVGFRSPPAALALWGVLDAQPHAMTATTLGPVMAAFLRRSTFLEFVRHRPAVTDAIISVLSRELRRRDITDGIGALKRAHERLACRLVQFTREYGEVTPTGVRINVQLSRRDLGGCVGIGVETAIRTVAQWQREALLSTSKQIIEIHDLEALRRIAGCDECQFDGSVFGPPPSIAS
jgi:CRP-like cAMP-binding protein